jgi:hypothetical protein
MRFVVCRYESEVGNFTRDQATYKIEILGYKM